MNRRPAPPPAAPLPGTEGRRALATRVAVGAALAAVALVDIWAGGPAFQLFVGLVVLLVAHEWMAMHRIARAWALAALLAVACAVLLAAVGRPGAALVVPLVAVVAAARPPAGAGRWAWPGGVAYAALPGVALVWLRELPDGFLLVLWSMALVWVTDILAFFVGRARGGPKLAPRISPNKTWSGLVGGVAGAGMFSLVLALAAGWPAGLVAGLGMLLALAAQGGDLFESHLKRLAGVKDSGSLLPGHGGVMDRVDGLVPVACLVAGGLALAGALA